ncbi:MAG: hypothetical protein LBG21_06425 [Campylobacteraceae bacterium]|jgi:flagellin-specific chaperone FliS|nr:hypothetical protein [Campylobacteraceae bacterium]
MESTKTIFFNIIKENKDSPHILTIIRDASFNLSCKILQNQANEDDIQKQLECLFEIFISTLHKADLKNSHAITSVIDGLIKAASYDKKQYFLKTIYEKEQLEASIYEQSINIKNLIAKAYDTIEEASKNLNESEKEEVYQSINDAKLLNVEALGILKEAVEEAFITTIEKARDIKDTVQEISKTFTYHAISENKFTKQKILSIASTILEVACDIADSDYANANDILNGAVEGVKSGISKAAAKFKNEIKFAPEEIKETQKEDIEASQKDIINMGESFVAMLKQCQLKSNGISSKILAQIIAEHNTYLAKLKRFGTEAAEAFSIGIANLKTDEVLKDFKEKAGKKFVEIKKETGEKVTAFTNDAAPKAKHVADEAKRLGSRAWETAKNVLDDVLKKGKKE